MSIFKRKAPMAAMNDVNLVILSLGGDRDAFCEIVSRYQNLLCSLAYSSVGDIKHSEDIAQEVFIDAWKKLNTLKEPEKLKAWLCGILRFKVSHYYRKENRQPLKGASELDEQVGHDMVDEQMDNTAIREQEQMLLWQTLDKIDQTYREPLILFYREHQSIERVASELDLSVDTAKQRLSRGRKLLKQAMVVFVEDKLANSKPGVAFTAEVLVAINMIPPAKAAVFGLSAGAAKSGYLYKALSFLAQLAAFAGVISSFFGLKASLDQSRTTREKQHAIKVVACFLIAAVIYVLGMYTLKYMALDVNVNLLAFATVSQFLVLFFVVSYLWLVYRMFAQTQKIRAQERIFNPQAFYRQADQKGAKQREYKSKLTLLGVPLFHFQFGMPETDYSPAVAWVAGGSKAYGLLFAWGGIAIAPISVGIISVGVVSVGAVGFGLIGIGTVGIGIIGFGASAVAYKAYGGLSALGWESAISNGFSIAKDAAIAPVAFASQVNNELAADIANLTLLDQSYQWVLALITILVITPSICYSYKVRQRMK